MLKTIFIKGGLKSILAIWFLLCILPGDCFLLGCVEKDSFHCNETETVVSSQTDADSPIPSADLHCPNCCVLCKHTISLLTFTNASNSSASRSSILSPPNFNHFDTI